MLINAFKINGTTMYISDDFSNRVREIQKHLWKSTAEEKENGARVKLLYYKLSIDDTLYVSRKTEKSRFKHHKKKGN